MTSADLLVSVVAALEAEGRTVEVDRNSGFDIGPASAGDAANSMGLFMPETGQIAIYCVWPVLVPADTNAEVAAYCVATNNDLYTSCLEFDSSNGTIAVRSGFRIDPALQLAADQIGALALLALDEVEALYREHNDPVLQLIGP